MNESMIHQEIKELRREQTDNFNRIYDQLNKIIPEVVLNTEFRKNHKAESRLWKRVLPSVITGIIVGLILTIATVLIPSKAGGAVLEELWISGAERKAKTVGSRDFEIAIGTGANQIGYEREEGDYGWIYDWGAKTKKNWYQIEYSDRFRGVWDIHWQKSSITFGKDLRIGGAFVGERYEDWKGMLVVEADWSQSWIKLSANCMTDFGGGWRWRVSGGPFVELSKRVTLQWKVDHWGDGEKDYGVSKIQLKVKS